VKTLRTYTTTAQAISDIAVLESQGIESQFKGDTQADSHQVVAGTVELQVPEENFAAAHRLLQTADRERFERQVPPAKRRKTVARYFKIAAATFVVALAIFAWKAPELSFSLLGIAIIALAAGGVATLIGFSAAVLDL
jgi:hypothetical protein